MGVRRLLALVLFGVVLFAGPATAQDPVIFADDFESGNLSAWDSVASDRYRVTSDPARVRSGNFALEGEITPDNGYGEINKWFMPGYDEIYFRFYVMFEEGFSNLRGDGNGMHFASVAGNNIANKWSSHGQAGIVPNGTDFFVTTVDPNHQYGDPALQPFMFYSYFPDMSCCYGNVFQQQAPALDLVPGQWHEVIVYVDAGTPGQADGSQSLWFDGQLKIDVQGMRWRDTTDLRLNEVMFVNYMPGATQTQRIWIDDVLVTTEFPGTEVSPGPFADVPGSHLFATEISWLRDQGITGGCDASRFCPDDRVSRAQMASFLVRAIGFPLGATDWFSDDGGSVHEANINALADAAVTLGCDNDLFCPGDSVTIGQMASFLVRALELPVGGSDWFSDDDGSVHEANINALANAAVTLGCGDGLFCPGDSVTRAQMAAFLYRALAES